MECSNKCASMYEATSWRQWSLALVIATLRGIGQVVFMNDARSGAVILLGLLIQSPFIGFCSLLATACGTIAGYALTFPAQKLNDGFYGYNGCLVGAAMGTFSPLMRWAEFAPFTNSIIPDSSFASTLKPLAVPSPGGLLIITVLAVGVFGALSTLLQEALINTLNRIFKLPTFTLGFNITTLVYFLAAFTFKFIPIDNAAILPTSQLPGPASFLSGSLTIDGVKFVQGAFIGVGQVFFCSHYLTSICVLIGMFLCSRSLAVVALLSSIGGAIVGLLVGANANEIYFGLWGYNSVLAGLSVFVLLKVNSSRQLISLACIGVFTAAILFSALRSFVAYWGVPVFTFPFCAAGLMLMALQPSFDRAAIRELRRKHKAVREQRGSENSDQSQSTTGSEGESELAIHVNPLFVEPNPAPPQEIDRV